MSLAKAFTWVEGDGALTNQVIFNRFANVEGTLAPPSNQQLPTPQGLKAKENEERTKSGDRIEG